MAQNMPLIELGNCSISLCHSTEVHTELINVKLTINAIVQRI